MLDLRGYGWMLWQGLELTILVGLAAMALALGLGLLGAWGKLSSAIVPAAGPPALTPPSSAACRSCC